MTILLQDDFTDDRPLGRALGPARGGDPRRVGNDREGIMGVDGGALRIAPPRVEGWGRTVLAYGPFPNEPGLAFSILLLNGHNTSQSEVMEDTLRLRVERWARGSGVAPVGVRMWRWLRSGRVRRVWRQARWWRRIANGSTRVTLMDENLAVGFFAAAAADDPLATGTGFVMHADGPRNGELWAGSPGSWAPVVSGVQNVPLYYVAVVRAETVALYVSSLPNSHGLGAYPDLRPVAVVPRPAEPELYVAVQQSLLGQIGFRADTRVQGVRVASLRSEEALAGSAVTLVPGPSPSRFHGFGTGDASLQELPSPAGLICLSLDPERLAKSGVTFYWRAGDDGDHWSLRLEPESVSASVSRGGTMRVVAEATWNRAPAELQILDDGREIAVLAAGELVFGRRFQDESLGAGTGVGVFGGGDGERPAVRVIEVQPRAVPLPEALISRSPWLVEPGAIVYRDPLDGREGDLEGATTPVGGGVWRRLLGHGQLVYTGDGGVRWLASVDEPLPGRTIYALDWHDPDYAELEVTLTPPGSARGQREHGTSGFCLWQDSDNYLLINTWLDDCYGGASLSSFPCRDGFEDLYDAIWTNVAERVVWGKPVRLRLTSDGLRYLVSLDGEPVLYRALDDIYPRCSPLCIRKIGLLGNWEWGADTGSRFADFRAAGRAPGDIGMYKGTPERAKVGQGRGSA